MLARCVSSPGGPSVPGEPPEKGEQEQGSGGRAGWRLLPVWAGGIGAAALVAILVLLVPDVRAGVLRRIVYPVVAQVLGREEITVAGVRVEAAPDPGLTAAFAVMVVLLLLAFRVFLLSRSREGWSSQVRVDTPFALALVPYLVLAPVLLTLASAQLFRMPWALFAVPPVLVLLVVAFVMASLVFAFWVENGGRVKGTVRLFVSLLLFLGVGWFWILALGGTTRAHPWWVGVMVLVLVVLVHYAVTLGNRIHSHRRALFSLGMFHLVFFSAFLVLWFLEGPWPVQEWSFEGQDAVREVRAHADGPLLLALAAGPPLLVAVGFYTVGAFLHAYAAWARVWVDGLSNLVVFAQVLDAWVVALMVMDPYGVLDHTVLAPGPFSEWAFAAVGVWGYLLLRSLFAVGVVLAMSLPRRMAQGRWLEFRTVLLGLMMGFGLVPGLRYSLRLALGV